MKTSLAVALLINSSQAAMSAADKTACDAAYAAASKQFTADVNAIFYKWYATGQATDIDTSAALGAASFTAPYTLYQVAKAATATKPDTLAVCKTDIAKHAKAIVAGIKLGTKAITYGACGMDFANKGARRACQSADQCCGALVMTATTSVDMCWGKLNTKWPTGALAGDQWAIQAQTDYMAYYKAKSVVGSTVEDPKKKKDTYKGTGQVFKCIDTAEDTRRTKCQGEIDTGLTLGLTKDLLAGMETGRSTGKWGYADFQAVEKCMKADAAKMKVDAAFVKAYQSGVAFAAADATKCTDQIKAYKVSSMACLTLAAKAPTGGTCVQTGTETKVRRACATETDCCGGATAQVAADATPPATIVNEFEICQPKATTVFDGATGDNWMMYTGDDVKANLAAMSTATSSKTALAAEVAKQDKAKLDTTKKTAAQKKKSDFKCIEGAQGLYVSAAAAIAGAYMMM